MRQTFAAWHDGWASETTASATAASPAAAPPTPPQPQRRAPTPPRAHTEPAPSDSVLILASRRPTASGDQLCGGGAVRAPGFGRGSPRRPRKAGPLGVIPVLGPSNLPNTANVTANVLAGRAASGAGLRRGPPAPALRCRGRAEPPSPTLSAGECDTPSPPALIVSRHPRPRARRAGAGAGARAAF